MTIGVIGAMQMEVDDLKAQMTDTQTEVYSGVEFVEGKIGDQYVVCLLYTSPSPRDTR